jgi:hypothetical protein
VFVQLNFTVNLTHFTDVDAMMQRFSDFNTAFGFIGLMSALKVFKFLAISKKLNALWLTLARAAPDLLTFLVG